MTNESNGTLYVPPQQTELLTMNTIPQQDTMVQPQDMLFGQPQRVNEQQDANPKIEVFNITDFLQETGRKEPTVKELTEQKLAEMAAAKKKKLATNEIVTDVIEQTQVRTKTMEEAEAEAEEEDRLRALEFRAKQANITTEEYLQNQALKDMLQEQEQEAEKEKLRQEGKVAFERGINSRPDSCERRRRKKSLAAAKKRLECNVGITHHTNKLLDQFDTGREATLQNMRVAMPEIKKIANERIERQKQQREEKIKKDQERMKKAHEKGEFLDLKNTEQVDEGFTEAESMLVDLAGFMPISTTGTILSPNKATRAIGLKALVDKAISCKIDANMISLVGLTKQLTEIRQLTSSIPLIAKLLTDNPEAKALMDSQKLALFESMEAMIPALKMGMEEGLRLNGLNVMGGSYYEDKPGVDVAVDKKDAMNQWREANYKLTVLGSSHQNEIDQYLADSQKSWEKHERFQLQTQKGTIGRYSVDVDAVTLLEGVKEYQDRHGKTVEMVKKSKEFQAAKDPFTSIVTGLVPIIATQEQMDAHVAGFRAENVEATVRGFVNTFLRMKLTTELPVAECAKDKKKLQELMQFRDGLRAISQLPGTFADIFKNTNQEVRPGKIKPLDNNLELRKMLRSAGDVCEGIDHQIEYLTLLHYGKPEMTEQESQIRLSNAFKTSQDTYKKFFKEFLIVSARAKANGW